MNTIDSFIHKVINIKNYISTNIMALYGYYYAYLLYQRQVNAEKIFLVPGADTTSEGILYSMSAFTELITFTLGAFILLIFVFFELFLREKNNFVRNKMIRPRKFITVVHTIIFWIGFWFPLSRLIVALGFVTMYCVAKIFNYQL